MNQFSFDSLDAVPTPLCLWAAIALMRRYSHMLDDYGSDHHGGVREIMVKAMSIAAIIKKEADAKKAKAAKKD